MIDGFPGALTLAAAIGAGLAAGVFFAFSTFVMAALRRLPDRQGLAAMQAINAAAPSPPFMAALVGTGLVCIALAITALTRLDHAEAVYQLVGSALYLTGVAVTVGYHIPRNDALAGVDPESAGAGDAWRRYLPGWTTGNHVRTTIFLAAQLVFTLGLAAG